MRPARFMTADVAEPFSAQVEIIGSLENGQAVTAGAIREALTYPRDLSRDGGFPGRPDTRIYASDDLVVKLRPALEFSAGDGRRWIAQRIAREQALGCYCPEKTWWLWHQEGGRTHVASATPRLRTLAMLMAGATEAVQISLLERVLVLYFGVVSRHDVALDEGLSNFGLDHQGRLYYLDDDDYPVNQFASLSASLAGWVRRFDQLSPAGWQQLGRHLRRVMLATLDDQRAWVMVAEQLRQQLAVNARQQQALSALTRALQAPSLAARPDAGR